MKNRKPVRKFSRRRAGITKAQAERLKTMHREIVMLRAGAERWDGGVWRGACERCGEMRSLYVSHIEGVGRAPSMRYDIDNARALCFDCHDGWWHQHPAEREEWLIGIIGAEKVEELRVRSKTRGSARLDYETVLTTLRAAA